MKLPPIRQSQTYTKTEWRVHNNKINKFPVMKMPWSFRRCAARTGPHILWDDVGPLWPDVAFMFAGVDVRGGSGFGCGCDASDQECCCGSGVFSIV